MAFVRGGLTTNWMMLSVYITEPLQNCHLPLMCKPVTLPQTGLGTSTK